MAGRKREPVRKGRHFQSKKVWGKEHWIVNTREYCGKILELKEARQCSLHYHKLKDETFLVVSGLVCMELGEDLFVLRAGDSIRIPRRAKHRFTGLTDSTIIEFSTKHRESDSYRLEESRRFKIGSPAWNKFLSRVRESVYAA